MGCGRVRGGGGTTSYSWVEVKKGESNKFKEERRKSQVPGRMTAEHFVPQAYTESRKRKRRGRLCQEIYMSREKANRTGGKQGGKHKKPGPGKGLSSEKNKRKMAALAKKGITTH